MAKLSTNLRSLLYKEKANTQNLSEVAKGIGISRATLYSLLYDNWKQIQRETIEKLCDYFNCDISQLFSIEEEPFWIPFKQKRDFYFIIGGSQVDLEEKENKYVIGFWDIKVMNEIITFLNKLPGEERIKFNVLSSLDFNEEEDEIIQFIKNHNTIIIGSPKTNIITEIVLAKLYDAKPFDSTKENKQKIPFRFARSKRWGVSVENSATSEITNERGIFSQKLNKVIARNEWYDDFFRTRIESGHDCGILVVANKPFETTYNVKLIIIAGYSGMGTLGVTRLMIKESKNLEPRGISPLIKAVEVEYKKPSANRDDREIIKIQIVQ